MAVVEGSGVVGSFVDVDGIVIVVGRVVVEGGEVMVFEGVLVGAFDVVVGELVEETLGLELQQIHR